MGECEVCPQLYDELEEAWEDLFKRRFIFENLPKIWGNLQEAIEQENAREFAGAIIVMDAVGFELAPKFQRLGEAADAFYAHWSECGSGGRRFHIVKGGKHEDDECGS